MKHPNCRVPDCPTCAKSASTKNLNTGQKRFCQTCGTDRTRFCQTCGTEIKKSAWNRMADDLGFIALVVVVVILIRSIL